MNILKFLLVIVIIGFQDSCQGQNIQPSEIKKVMQKVADWHIEHSADYNRKYKHDNHPLAWPNGALYAGMVKWAAMVESDKYYEWLKNIGNDNEWKLHDRVYHADDHVVGQMYLELYRKYGDKKLMEPTLHSLDFIIYHPAKSLLQWQSPFHQDRWNWCDALFMSPPVWAKAYQITGDKKYLDFMIGEYKATTDFLFDEEEHLYFRDERYKTKQEYGAKIFWSRGNGWVFAGLPNIMNELDPTSEEYQYFLDIYRKMARKLITLQTAQGHWPMSLLGEKYYPTPETSGSSFYIYGLAWGINQGILDEETYLPIVVKGWTAMVGYVNEEGMLGYVQPIGAAPDKAWADVSEAYGVGAFLSAGSEVYQLFGGK